MSKEKTNENIAKAVLKDTSISTKMAVEVCSFIRNKRFLLDRPNDNICMSNNSLIVTNTRTTDEKM